MCGPQCWHTSDSSSMADRKEGDGKLGSYKDEFSFWPNGSEMLWTFLCRELEIQIGIQDIKGISADLSPSLDLIIDTEQKDKGSHQKGQGEGKKLKAATQKIYGNKKRMEQKSYKNREKEMPGKDDQDGDEANGVHRKGGSVHFPQEIGEEPTCSTPSQGI